MNLEPGRLLRNPFRMASEFDSYFPHFLIHRTLPALKARPRGTIPKLRYGLASELNPSSSWLPGFQIHSCIDSAGL